MIIGCTGNYRKTDYYNIIGIINEFLSNHDVKCIISSDLYNDDNIDKSNIDKNLEIVDFSKLVKLSDIILCIGGDGTFLSTSRRIGISNVPLLGVHIGGLGFLAEISKDNIHESLKYIIDGNYAIEERMKIKLLLSENNDLKEFSAINDIVIDHGESGRILKTKINVDNHYLNTYESDGIIISTSIGSTAYSLSAGGPIIHPAIESITITPICSHSLSARSIVLNGDKLISIEFPELYQGISCTVDGQQRFLIGDSSKLEIKKSHENVKIIILPSYNYYNTVRNKMRWSGNLR